MAEWFAGNGATRCTAGNGRRVVMVDDAVMPDHSVGSPWWWRDFDEAFYNECWDAFATWVDWLVEAYSPWVVLPPCWALHEGMANELKIFWNWYESAIKVRANPVDAVRWHQDMRSSATAWRELATCKHEPDSGHLPAMSQRRKVKAADFIQQARQRGRGTWNG